MPMPDFSLRPHPGIHPSSRSPSSIHGTADPCTKLQWCNAASSNSCPDRGKGNVCVYKACPECRQLNPEVQRVLFSWISSICEAHRWAERRLQSGDRAVPSALHHPSPPPPPAPGALHHLSQTLTYLGASMETASVMNDKSAAELNDGK